MGMMYIPELNKLPFHKAKWFERLRRVQVAAIVHSDGTHIDHTTRHVWIFFRLQGHGWLWRSHRRCRIRIPVSLAIYIHAYNL